MKITIVHNGKIISSYDFMDGNYKIGRSSKCEIRIDSPQVSKEHALLVIKEDKAAIVDLGSSNGTFVNGILIKKQRIEPKDEISIAGYKLVIGKDFKKQKIELESSSISPVLGNSNLAEDVNLKNELGESEIRKNLSPQERFLELIEKSLQPFYDVTKSVDWRLILSGIIVISLTLSVILTVIPFISWGVSSIKEEALNRAHVLVSQVVRENYRILTKGGDISELTVDILEVEKSILSAYIFDAKTKTILAPAKHFNKNTSDIWIISALDRIIKNNEKKVSLERKKGLYVLAQPIEFYSVQAKEQELAAVVVAYFEIPDNLTSTFQPFVSALLFAIFIGLLAFYLIFKQLTFPISQLNEQLDAALKGEPVSVRCESKFGELITLSESINFAVSKIRQSDAGAIMQEDEKKEDDEYLKSMIEFCEGSSDGIILLDSQKRVKYLNNVIEELVGMRLQYSQGQNISDACKDPGLAGTAIDLVDNVLKSIGQTQIASLDINGINREIVAAAHKSRSGEIRFVIIIVKLGESPT